MDILAHALWTNVVFIKRPSRERWLAILFALLPDFVSFGPHFVNSFLNGNFNHRQNLERVDPFAVSSYNFTHSLIIAAFIILIISIIFRRLYLPLLSWPLHIVIDIFSHSRVFFPTPFLFPFLDFKVDAISWGNPTFLKINYILLIASYIIIFLFRFKKQNHANANPTQPPHI